MPRILAITVSLVALAFACIAVGCSASSKAGGTGNIGDCPSASVSFQNDVMPVFAGSCSTATTCHGQKNNRGEENLYLGLGAEDGANGPSDVAAVYAGLVGVKSMEDPSMSLVTVGDLETSYLWHKVSGDENTDPAVVSGCDPAEMGSNPCSDCISGAPCGAQMPFAGNLAPSAVCVIENWIGQGAKDN